MYVYTYIYICILTHSEKVVHVFFFELRPTWKEWIRKDYRTGVHQVLLMSQYTYMMQSFSFRHLSVYVCRLSVCMSVRKNWTYNKLLRFFLSFFSLSLLLALFFPAYTHTHAYTLHRPTATISYLYPTFDPSLKANGSGDLYSFWLYVEWSNHSKTEVVRSSSLWWMQNHYRHRCRLSATIKCNMCTTRICKNVWFLYMYIHLYGRMFNHQVSSIYIYTYIHCPSTVNTLTYSKTHRIW